jgi:DNA-binding GntR family transcriptional regulator
VSLEALDLQRAGDLVYTSIRDAILGGKLEPGCRLNQDELARRLGVSRGPVRDALRRLEAEGLVQTLAKRGVVVATIASQELQNIFELRAVLDSYSHRLACERIGEEELGRLQDILDRTETLTPDGDIHELVRAHAEFHFVIYAACGNPELERVARSLWDRSYRYRVIALSTKAIARLTLDEHREILAALRERNAQRVEALLVQHNRVSIERLLPGVAGAEGAADAPPAHSAADGDDRPQ